MSKFNLDEIDFFEEKNESKPHELTIIKSENEEIKGKQIQKVIPQEIIKPINNEKELIKPNNLKHDQLLNIHLTIWGKTIRGTKEKIIQKIKDFFNC